MKQRVSVRFSFNVNAERPGTTSCQRRTKARIDFPREWISWAPLLHAVAQAEIYSPWAHPGAPAIGKRLPGKLDDGQV